MSELSRLRWLCRRGMKELDVVMSRYLERNYESASAVDRLHFRELLEMPDPDLYDLLLGRSEAKDPALQQFVGLLRAMSAQD
jgi:antitoxin CptB